MEMIHGNGQGLMGLLGNGAVGHGPRLKPLYDFLYRLYLFERYGSLRVTKIHQAS